MTFAYLGALAFSLLGLGVLDWRHRIALFDQPRRSAATIATAVVFFLALDIIGVGLGIFFRGTGPYMTGILVAPEIPLEEVFFLTLLSYQTLLVWRYFDKRTAAKAAISTAGEAS